MHGLMIAFSKRKTKCITRSVRETRPTQSLRRISIVFQRVSMHEPWTRLSKAFETRCRRNQINVPSIATSIVSRDTCIRTFNTEQINKICAICKEILRCLRHLSEDQASEDDLHRMDLVYDDLLQGTQEELT